MSKERFIEIYNNNIKRQGAEELLDWLNKSDFFTAPASTRYHSCYEGGLCYHSILVYERLIAGLEYEFKDKWQDYISAETAAICGLLHDVCKVDFYKIEYKNTKVDGEWVKLPYYKVEEALPYGHGEKSVYIINSFMRLTREEALAINWHMGGFDARVLGGSYAMNEAYDKHYFSAMMHIADIQATFLNENTRLTQIKLGKESDKNETR